MKFVCDNCQAKYQIGDDKVAGKTVRMKCRKCGYNIKVPAGGQGDGGADAAQDGPVSHSGHDIPAPPASVQLPTPATRAAPPRPADVASPSTWGEDDESTAMMNLSVREAVVAATSGVPAPPVSPVSPAPSPAAPPRPGAPLPPRPNVTPIAKAPAPRPLTTAPHPAAERPRSITHTSTPRPVPGPPLRHSSGSMPAARPVTRTSTGSLAAVKLEAGAHSPPHLVTEPEWYVGIAGAPIGPVRVSVIRERAAANEVDGESLVWREGMGEWRPLRTFPELLEVVNAAHAPAPLPPRPAPGSPVGVPQGAPGPGAPTTPPPGDAAPLAAVAGLAAAVATPPQPVAPVALATPAPPPPAAFVPAAPAAAPPPAANILPDAALPVAPIAVAAPATALAAALVEAPASPAPRPAARAREDLDTSLEDSLIPRRRGGVHPMAYAFVAAAAVFGGVAAWVLLRPPQPQIVVVQAPPPPAATSTAGSVAEKTGDKSAATAEVEVGELTTPGSTATPRGVNGGGPRPKGPSSATASTPVAPMDTSSFQNNVPGPAATAATPPPTGGGQLSSGEISAVVAQNQAIIKRKCWVPALEAKAPNAPANVRVVGNIVIGASGSVESASASGGERDFPGLSSCISSRMKNWKFPASGSSTPVNVPFVFAGQ